MVSMLLTSNVKVSPDCFLTDICILWLTQTTSFNIEPSSTPHEERTSSSSRCLPPKYNRCWWQGTCSCSKSSSSDTSAFTSSTALVSRTSSDKVLPRAVYSFTKICISLLSLRTTIKKAPSCTPHSARVWKSLRRCPACISTCCSLGMPWLISINAFTSATLSETSTSSGMDTPPMVVAVICMLIADGQPCGTSAALARS
mmetsp:Transcript_28147/g.77718  ORF Transcript_28147/g.77718 Transcript_28147/m.77718 type:complete len:200 (-) Transcript_28147:198-797(-)